MIWKNVQSGGTTSLPGVARDATRVAVERIRLDGLVDVPPAVAEGAMSYLGPIAASVFVMDDFEGIVELTRIAVLLDLAARALDSLADRPDLDCAALSHQVALIMSECSLSAGEFVRGDARLGQLWQRSLRDASCAQRLQANAILGVATMGDAWHFTSRKLAYSNAVFALAALRSGARELLEGGTGALASLLTAVQLIDDLMDCDSDLKAGVVTIPTILLNGNLMESDSSLDEDDKRLQALCLRVFGDVADLLDDSIHRFSLLNAECVVQCIVDCRSAILDLRSNIRRRASPFERWQDERDFYVRLMPVMPPVLNYS